MKFRQNPSIIVFAIALLVLPLSGEAKNRNSLWGKVKSAFSSQPKPDPSPRHAAIVRQEPVAVYPQSRPIQRPVVSRPPSPAHVRPSSSNPALAELRRRAEIIAKRGLPYKFGGESPSEGGMDCSGTMQHLLSGMGVRNVPRTSFDQYAWVKNSGKLRRRAWGSDESAYQNLRPGDLIFWGNTYNSGHKVSHVMLYLGRANDGRHYMFGAKGKKSRGLNGSGVDVFEMKPGKQGKLVGYGSIPGLRM